MSISAEEFGESLLRQLTTRHSMEYLFTARLRSAIMMALVPANAEGREYPRMLYRRAVIQGYSDIET